MQISLSNRIATEAATDRQQRILYDAEIRGFGLRVTRAGGKSWIYNYSFCGVERRMTIGRFPAMSASVARSTAKEMRAASDLGRDPLAEQRRVRREEAKSTAALRAPQSKTCHYLYRMFDDASDLLWVGETKDVGERLKNHRAQSRWYHEFAMLTLVRLASRAEAQAAEHIAIRDENPRYNVHAGFRSPELRAA